MPTVALLWGEDSGVINSTPVLPVDIDDDEALLWGESPDGINSIPVLPIDIDDVLVEGFSAQANLYTKQLQVCIITRVKNYAEWLPEWIEYHHLLGVDKLFIVDDCSTDGNATQQILDVYAGLGYVQYWYQVRSCAHKTNEQIYFKFAFQKAKSAGCEWVAAIDVDEYISIAEQCESETLPPLVDFLNQAGSPWQPLGWWIIGPNGHEHKPAGLMIENFKLGRLSTIHTKTIAKSSIVLEWACSLRPTKVERPYARMLKLWKLQWPQHKIMRMTVDGKDIDMFKGCLYLKHYIYRSWEEYRRGRGSTKIVASGNKSPWYNNRTVWESGAAYDVAEIGKHVTTLLAGQVRRQLCGRRMQFVPYFNLTCGVVPTLTP